MCGWVVACHGAAACQLNFYFLTRTLQYWRLSLHVDITALHRVFCLCCVEIEERQQCTVVVVGSVVEVLCARWLYCTSMTSHCPWLLPLSINTQGRLLSPHLSRRTRQALALITSPSFSLSVFFLIQKFPRLWSDIFCYGNMRLTQFPDAFIPSFYVTFNFHMTGYCAANIVWTLRQTYRLVLHADAHLLVGN